ncbi:MAG: carboxypeptidase regulatory-like domain-containing protein, partial [Gemmatimonadota bacterium]|nr:carboxypeptidase regulatory-like domain-containing protein [Gemmatimonadota bacterium]
MRYPLLAALLCAPSIVWSQQTRAGQSHATVSGVAVDSVRGGYLRGAIVYVSGTALSAMTDSSGRFRIDSVTPGTRHLELMHPLLDSIALRVRSPERELKAGDTTIFILSVPSPATIVATKCSAEEIGRGKAALVGTVTEGDTGAPAPGATVSVEWLEYQLGRRSMNRLPHRRTGSVRSDGTYRVCGIPDDLTTGTIAFRGADSTTTVAATFTQQLAVVSFRIPGPVGALPATPSNPLDLAAPRAVARGSATLTGKVVDPGGSPLANARVAVESEDASAMTDNNGEFSLTGLRTGTRGLSVRRLGFAAKDLPVDVSAAAPRSVTVTLERYVAILDAVRISAIRDIGLQRVGFADRQRAASGRFFGPDEIDKRNPQRLSTLLETTPSLRMGTNQDGKRYISGRHNGCV